MKVFISWSGNKSQQVAAIFRDWLPSVIQSIEPYVSSEDIDKGARWSTDIAKELENSTFGILCVTKDNLEAPWLSFEAGALSKTMEKSFVTPFLFDIKRSEVQGPILQFQSTVFEKDDIRKMVKTLNKACGDGSITENRLDTAFDVWYPRLEDELNRLKNENDTSDSKKKKEAKPVPEVLEEILELSRDNQKLLRSPNTQLSDDIESLKQTMEQLIVRTSITYERRRSTRKYNSIFFEEIIHRTSEKSSYGFLMLLSLFREDFPWIYDMGKEMLDILKSERDRDQKMLAIREFKDMIEFTCGHPAVREVFGSNKESMLLMKDLPYYLIKYMDEMEERYSK